MGKIRAFFEFVLLCLLGLVAGLSFLGIILTIIQLINKIIEVMK